MNIFDILMGLIIAGFIFSFPWVLDQVEKRSLARREEHMKRLIDYYFMSKENSPQREETENDS